MLESNRPDAPRKRIVGWRRGLLVAAVSLLLVELSLQGIVRLWGPRGFNAEDLGLRLARTQARAKTYGHPYLAYALKPDWATKPGVARQTSHNGWGYRGQGVPPEKPDDVYRIVCLGGSSTYGTTISSDATTWPARLEHWLNDPSTKHQKRVEVVNGGAPGWSTFESAVNLSFRMLEWEPDLVIVYHTINDMRCALYWNPPVADNSHWRAVWPSVTPAPMEHLLENSMTYVFLRRFLTRYDQAFKSLNHMAIVGYDRHARDLYLVGDAPAQGFRNFERNLVSIQAVARAHGAVVILGTQGCDLRDIRSVSGDNQIAGFERMTEILREVASERDLILVDARAALDQEAEKVGIDQIYTREVHLTDRGADRLARAFAARIIADRLVE